MSVCAVGTLMRAADGPCLTLAFNERIASRDDVLLQIRQSIPADVPDPYDLRFQYNRRTHATSP